MHTQARLGIDYANDTSAGEITTPAELKSSPDFVIADEMGECAGLVKAAAERKKDAQPKNEALLANLENGSIGYTAVSLFYIRSHFRHHR